MPVLGAPVVDVATAAASRFFRRLFVHKNEIKLSDPEPCYSDTPKAYEVCLLGGSGDLVRNVNFTSINRVPIAKFRRASPGHQYYEQY